MKTTIFNLEAIVSIEVKDKIQVNSLEYIPSHKSFFGKTVDECFRDKILSRSYTRKQILEGMGYNLNLIIIDNVVYYSPKTIAHFVGGDKVVFPFKSYEEAQRKANLLKSENLTKTLEVYE